MITRDLNAARFLYRKLPNHIRQEEQYHIETVWNIGVEMWQNHFAQVFAQAELIDTDELLPLKDAFIQSYRERMRKHVGQCYSRVTVNKLGQFLHLPPHEVLQC